MRCKAVHGVKDYTKELWSSVQVNLLTFDIHLRFSFELVGGRCEESGSEVGGDGSEKLNGCGFQHRFPLGMP